MRAVNKYLIPLLLIPALASGKGNHKLDTTPELETDVWTVQIEENYYHTKAVTLKTLNVIPTST
jgi:hypothetical protein